MAMRTIASVPHEIIFDIILRLPAKCIGKVRCVSKQWRTLLSDPYFIKTHLTIHSREADDELVVAADGKLYSLAFTHNPHSPDGDSIMTPTELISEEQQLQGKFWIDVAGSCNGLVLVVAQNDFKILINPTTLKYHEIPKCQFPCPKSCNDTMFGFGYDIVNDDYKVVAISYFDEIMGYAAEQVADSSVDVYSVRKDLWRRLENYSPYDHSFPIDASGPWVNGALHWLASRKSADFCVIVAFDLSEEKFLEVPTPDSHGCYFEFKLLLLRGCLCLFNSSSADTILVWMMKATELRSLGPYLILK